MAAYQVSSGGKLYVAGEYAVLSPGQTAILAYIPIKMQASISSSPETLLESDLFNHTASRQDDPDFALIQESISTFEAFLGRDLPDFHLSFRSHLGQGNLKYGIGSSGSVTILTLKALAALMDIDLSPDLLFKLAAYTLLKRGDNGSMGDVACIAYESWIAYQSFDRQALAQKVSQEPLKALLEEDWGYTIRLIQPKIAGHFLVGWTKEPALSKDLIKAAKSLISASFLEKTEAAVLGCEQALTTGNWPQLCALLQEVSDLLEGLSPGIYVSKLKALKAAEEGLDVIAKSSGAGGGDCGIAFAHHDADQQKLVQLWQEIGIDLLYHENFSVKD